MPRRFSRGVFVPKSLDGEAGVCNSPSSLVSKLNTLDYGRSGRNVDGISVVSSWLRWVRYLDGRREVLLVPIIISVGAPRVGSGVV